MIDLIVQQKIRETVRDMTVGAGNDDEWDQHALRSVEREVIRRLGDKYVQRTLSPEEVRFAQNYWNSCLMDMAYP